MARMAVQNGKKTVLYLFRNDLRVHDNECLKWAQQNGDHILPLYCFQPEHFASTYHFKYPRCGIHRAQFLVETVADLRKNLKNLGTNLVVRRQCPVSAVSELIELCSNSSAPIHALVYQKEITPEETDQENQLAKLCLKHSIGNQAILGSMLFHKEDIPYKRPSDYPDTFTKFRQGVEARSKVRDIIPTPSQLRSLPPIPSGAKLGDIPSLVDLGFMNSFELDSRSAFGFKGGESAALDRLNEYLWITGAVATYKETRNGLVGKNYSTKFSPWLANGSLSPRRIYHEVKLYEYSEIANNSTYWVIFELLWRDFFRYIAIKYGKRIFFLTGIMDRSLPWKQDEELFRKWSLGETGVPFIDASMRELLHTGWMSNRSRQNVASFLVKDLKLDWRMGAEWFESLLLDHDPCSNYGNWNYSAGIGTDPRQDRKFNIIKQSLEYDGDGEFVKMWLPELKDIPADKVHYPWRLAENELLRYNVKLGHDYPKPLVQAPEWGKFMKTSVDKGKGQERGIDFYFKSNSKK